VTVEPEWQVLAGVLDAHTAEVSHGSGVVGTTVTVGDGCTPSQANRCYATVSPGYSWPWGAAAKAADEAPAIGARRNFPNFLR